jgi:transcriptional regulator GlxA family with amidase domain
MTRAEAVRSGSVAAKVNVAIFVFDDVEVLDFAGPFEVFSRTRLTPGLESRRTDDSAPFSVFAIAERPETITAIGGLQVIPRYDFRSAPPIDILVVPGGWGTRALLEHQPVLEWIRATALTATLVTSVCSGALLLARVGLLHQRRATTHWGALDTLASLDPTIVVERDARFVHDGPVTSAGISAGIDMALSIVERLHGKAIADDTAFYMEYTRTPSARGSALGSANVSA